MTPEKIVDTFSYHSPGPENQKVHEAIRERITETVLMVADLIPESRERSLFITHMQQAQMFANAAVAIHRRDGQAHIA